MKKLWIVSTYLIALLLLFGSLVFANVLEVTIDTVVSGSTTELAHPAEHLIDGRPNTSWRLMPHVSEGWAELRLTNPTLIHGVQLSGELEHGSQIIFEYEKDNHWYQFLGGALVQLPQDGTIDLSAAQVVTEKIRVRIVNNFMGNTSIAEITILGENAEQFIHRIEPEEIIASDNTIAFNPVRHLFDGNTNTSWKTGNGYGEVLLTFDNEYQLSHFNFYVNDDATGLIKVEAKTDDGWNLLTEFALPSQAGWYRRDSLLTGTRGEIIRISVTGNANELGGIGEFEVWGYGNYQGILVEQQIDTPFDVNQAAVNIEFDALQPVGWDVAPYVPDQSLEVFYKANNLQHNTNSLQHNIKLRNTGPLPVDLSSVVLKYWLTVENEGEQVAEVYWSNIGGSNVLTEVVALDEPKQNADHYLEIRFSENAGILGPQTEIELHLGLHATNWSYYDQQNDHSFMDNALDYLSNKHYTGYIDGYIAWGDEPAALEPEVMGLLSLRSMGLMSFQSSKSASLEVEYVAKSLAEVTNSLQHNLRLVNTGQTPVELQDISLRYWYNNEPFKEQIATIYWSNVGTQNVTTTFVELEKYIPEANQYLELGFQAEAGILMPGMAVEIHLGFNTFDWSNYNQINDYSYDPTAIGFQLNEKYTAYINSDLMWGIEPSGLTAGDLGRYKDYLVKFTVAGNNTNSVMLELNGNKMMIEPSFVLRDETYYVASLSNDFLLDGGNSLRMVPSSRNYRVNQLQIASKYRDGEQEILGVPTPTLRLTPLPVDSQYTVSLKGSTLIESVDIFGEDHTLEVYAYLGNQWVSIAESTDPVKTDLIRILNPSYAELTGIRIKGSLTTNEAPSIKILEPKPGSIVDLGNGTSNLVGFIDNAKADLIINGREIPLSGHYFSVKLDQLGLIDGEVNLIEIVAQDTSGRQTIKTLEVFVGQSLEFSIDQKDELLYSEYGQFVISGQVAHDSHIVIVGDKIVPVMNGKFTTTIQLDEGYNEIDIIVQDETTDAFGKAVRRIIYHQPFIELKVDAPIDGSYVNEATINLAGKIRSNKNYVVRVNGAIVDVENDRFLVDEFALVEGSNDIIIEAETDTGLVATERIRIIGDSTAPEITAVLPTHNHITADRMITFSGAIDDESQVRIFVEGTVVPVIDGFFSVEIPMNEGIYDVQIRAQDLAGNTSYFTVNDLIVDLTPPASFTVFPDPSNWTNDTQPILTFATRDETSGISHYELVINGELSGLIESPHKLASLPDGEHEIGVWAVDRSGRRTLAQTNVFIDTTPPIMPEIFRVIPGNQQIVLKWDPSSPDTMEYIVERAGAEVLYTTNENEIAFLDLSNGEELNFRVWAVDRAHNASVPTEWKSGIVGFAREDYIPDSGAIVEYETVTLTIPKEGLPAGISKIEVSEITSDYMDDRSSFPIVSPIYEFAAYMEGEDQALEHMSMEGGYLGQIEYDPASIPEGFPEQNLDVYYYDTMFDQWIMIDSSAVDVENNTVYFVTNHFSAYSVQATVVQDLTPQEYKDAGYSPLRVYSEHEGIQISPQGGTASTSHTELVLPGVNGFDLTLERRYDGAVAVHDAKTAGVNMYLGFNFTDANAISDSVVVYNSISQWKQAGSAINTLWQEITESYLNKQGDYAYSMGNGWRLNIPYVRKTNSGLQVVTPTGTIHSINEMELLAFTPLAVGRSLTFKQSEGEDFLFVAEQHPSIATGISADFEPIFKGTWQGMGYTLAMADGTVYEMDAFGKTTRIIAPNGIQEINLYYDGMKLDYIEDTVGRQIRFAYETPNAISWPRISRIWVTDDGEFAREVNYQINSDGTLATAQDVAGRMSFYEYGDELLLGGTAGVKINVATIIANLVGSPVTNVINSIFGQREVELYGNLQARLINPLTRMEAPGQSVVEIDYLSKSYDYANTDISWFLFIPTSVNLSVNVAYRLLADEVRVIGASDAVERRTAFTYDLDYHSEGQPFIQRTTEQDGAKRTEYYYSDVRIRRNRWEDNYAQVNNNLSVPIVFPNKVMGWHILPLNTRTEVYAGNSNWLLEAYDLEFDIKTMKPTHQTTWRGANYLTQEYVYDDWGNVVHYQELSESHGRINQLERFMYYANTNSEPSRQVSWLSSPYDQKVIKSERRNLPIGELVANYVPSQNGQAQVTYLSTYYDYDQRGNVIAASQWSGSEWQESTFVYDAATGLLQTQTNPEGNQTLYEYDSNGYPSATIVKDVIDAAGNPQDISNRTSYDVLTGWLMWEQNPRGYVTEYEHDALGRVVKIVEPDDDDELKWIPDGSSASFRSNNPVTSFEYNDDEIYTIITDPLGNQTRYNYDILGRLVEEIKYRENGTVGMRVGLAYDGWNNITAITDPNDQTTNYEYDSLGRMAKIIHPVDSGERPSFDMSFDYYTNIETSLDENNNRIDEYFDMMGRVIKRVAYTNQGTVETNHYFDGLGNEVITTDPKGSVTINQYNSLNELVEVTLPAENVWENDRLLSNVTPYQRYEYNKAGYLTRIITSAPGNQEQVLWYETDGIGRVIKTIQAPGTIYEALTETYYDENGNVIREVDANNTPLPKGQQQAFSYVYSARDLVLEETDPAGNTVKYSYDLNGNPVSFTDQRGTSNNYAGDFTIEYEYDVFGRLVAGYLPRAQGQTSKPVVKLEYDARGNLVKRIEPDGGATVYTYTPRNWVASETIQGAGLSYAIHYKYDQVGNLTGIIDGAGSETRRSFDSLNRLVLVEYPAGNVEAFTYDENGNKIGQMDGRNWTEFSYDRYNRLVERKDAKGGTTLYQYDRLGNQTGMINALEHSYRYSYDDLNRIIGEEDALQNSYTYGYDAVGNRVTAKDPNGTEYIYSYYPNNLVQSINLTNGAYRKTLNYTYDEAGYLIRAQDGAIITEYNQTEQGYVPDPFGRVYSENTIIDGIQRTIEYSYDVMGRTTGIRYPDGEWIEYEYNQVGQLTKVPGLIEQAPVYDQVGRLTQLMAVNGVANTIGYDQNGRYATLRYNQQGSTLKDYTYSYDHAGNMSRKNNDQYQYDELNQLIFAGLMSSHEISRENYPLVTGRAFDDYFGQAELQFDLAETELIELDYASGSVGINLNGLFPVTRVEINPLNSTHRVHADSIQLYTSNSGSAYQEVTAWTAEELENGGLKIILHTPTQARYVKVHSLFDDRDGDFKPVNKAEFINEAKEIIDVYYLVDYRQEEYSYDAGGNRSEASVFLRETTTNAYVYYQNSNRLMTDGEYGFSYDANGNMIAKGTNFTQTDNEITIHSQGEYWNYQYNLLNQLIAVAKNGQTIVTYAYNEAGLRVKRAAPEGPTYYSFNLDDQVIYEQTREANLSYVYAFGQHFAMIDESDTYFYHTDHLGSTVLVTNNEGEAVWSNEYTPFGQVNIETTLFTHAIKFTGKDLDEATGLYYFNARWYDPSLGRFISEDPIKDGLNWYTYVMNNPLVYVDPTGLEVDKSLFSTLGEYLDGHISDSDVEEALKQIADQSNIELMKYQSRLYPSRDYQRYDDFIVGWTEYFNDKNSWNIDPEVTKAMMYIETKMGYYPSSSPNANVSSDVMQVLDPRNPTVYEFANINSERGSLVLVHNSNRQYVVLNSLDPYYAPGVPTGRYTFDVSKRLFTQSGGFYVYQYDQSTPVLSTALGVFWYGHHLSRVTSNVATVEERAPLEAARRYNVGDARYVNKIEQMLKGGNIDEF